MRRPAHNSSGILTVAARVVKNKAVLAVLPSFQVLLDRPFLGSTVLGEAAALTPGIRHHRSISKTVTQGNGPSEVHGAESFEKE